MRAALILVCLVVSAICAYILEPYVAHNSDAILILITVFTVFAGFLVAIVAILGDPALLPGESWRAAELKRDQIEENLVRHMWLFVLYLITIGLIFIGVVVQKIPPTVVPNAAKTWIGRSYLFFGISAFFFTFGLAKSLFKIQLARIDRKIEELRAAVGIKPDDH